jgi:hypothetical protein
MAVIGGYGGAVGGREGMMALEVAGSRETPVVGTTVVGTTVAEEVPDEAMKPDTRLLRLRLRRA